MADKLQPGDIQVIARKPRMWDAELPVTAYVEGPLAEWPEEMQDMVFEAMEQIITDTGIKALDLVQATCFRYESGIYVARITIMEKLGPEDVVIARG